MNSVKCTQCGKIFVNRTNYQGQRIKCSSCRKFSEPMKSIQPMKSVNSRRTIQPIRSVNSRRTIQPIRSVQSKPEPCNFDKYRYPTPPDYYMIDKGCGYCRDALWFHLKPEEVENIPRANFRQLPIQNTWLNTLSQTSPKFNGKFLTNYLIYGLDFADPDLLISMYQTCGVQLFPVVICGIPEFAIESTSTKFYSNPCHPGYFNPYFTHRYPTREEYLQIKSFYPNFYFGKPNRMVYHGN